jgi:hypothetical protein
LIVYAGSWRKIEKHTKVLQRIFIFKMTAYILLKEAYFSGCG